jgi:hypothetical protein
VALVDRSSFRPTPRGGDHGRYIGAPVSLRLSQLIEVSLRRGMPLAFRSVEGGEVLPTFLFRFDEYARESR